MLNGVIAGEYIITMKIVDLTTGATVLEKTADNGPFNLDPHNRATAQVGLVLTRGGKMVIYTILVFQQY